MTDWFLSHTQLTPPHRWEKFKSTSKIQCKIVHCLIPFFLRNLDKLSEQFNYSFSLKLRHNPSKTYHSVTRNVSYKVIPSLLLPRPPRHSHTSNRLPLLPDLFLDLVGTRSQRFEKSKNSFFSKNTSIEFPERKF
jgi:hypothetical protein